MLTYKRHNCTRSHRTFAAFAKCVWPRATSISGEGEWATIASCRPGTWQVELHATERKAREALALIRGSGCGGACRLGAAEAAGRHKLIRLAK